MHIPRYVGEDESYRRSVKTGWFVVSRNGMLVSGPFVGHAECVEQIRDPKRAPINKPSDQNRHAQVRVASSWQVRRVCSAPVAKLTRAGPFWVIA